MRKLLLIVLALLLVHGLYACSTGFDAGKIVDALDGVTEYLGRAQMTGDRKLVGRRTYTDGDHYVGTYAADCEGTNGREVLFGGTSVRERKVKVSAVITTESGSAAISIRLGSKTVKYDVGEDGTFEKEVEFGGGANYVMLDYEDFTGTVALSVGYVK